jgi:hypothetical protein
MPWRNLDISRQAGSRVSRGLPERVRALNKVDLPMFGEPTIPARSMAGLQQERA